MTLTDALAGTLAFIAGFIVGAVVVRSLANAALRSMLRSGQLLLPYRVVPNSDLSVHFQEPTITTSSDEAEVTVDADGRGPYL